MLAAQGILLIVSLLVTALLARALSKEAFGLWSVVRSLAAFGGHLDLGLGQGLRNKLAALTASRAVGMESEQHKYYLSVFYILLCIALIGISASAVLTPLIPWVTLFRIHDPVLVSTIVPVMITVLSLLFVNVPLNLSGWGFFAYQESHWRSLMDTLRSVLFLASVAIAARLSCFFGIVSSYYVASNLAALLGMVVFFRRRGWSLVWPSWRDQLQKVRPLVKISLQFWLLGLFSTVVFSTSPLIVSRVAGLAEAGDFSLVQRAFALLVTSNFTVLTPLWSAYTQAAEVGDWVWVRRNLRRSAYATLVVFIGGGSLLVALHKPILYLWAEREISNLPLVLIMAVWALITGWNSCFSVVLNSLSRIKVQTLLIVVLAILNVPLSLFLGYRYGVVGVSLGSIITILPLAVSNTIQVYHLLNKQEKLQQSLKDGLS